MADDLDVFGDKIKNSFSNVKEDMFKLEKDLETIKKEIKEGKRDKIALESLLQSLKKDISEIKSFLADSKKSSTGNKGVTERYRTIPNNAEQYQTVPNSAPTMKKPASLPEIQAAFRTLTDREFSVFLSIFELGQQFGETNYLTIATHLNVTESPVRNAVNALIAKGLPVVKERVFNGKTSLFINKAFTDHHSLVKLIQSRQNLADQTTLS